MKLILAVVLVVAIYYKHANASTDLRQNATDVERPMKTVWVKESLLAEVGKTTSQHAYRDDFLEAIIRQLFGKYMAKAAHPSAYPETGIQDPAQIHEEIAFSKTVATININLKAWDINVFGLSLLKMTFLRIVRVNNLRDIKVLVKLCSDLHLEGKYQLLGKAMGVLPLSGSGKFTIAFKDFCVAGVTILSLEDLQDRQKPLTLKVRELDAAVKSDKVHFDFQNLMGGGTVGVTANHIVNSLGHTIMHSQKEKLVEMIAKVFHETISYYL